MLVVEDDEEIADVLRRSLRNEGYEVRTSADGVDALDVAAGFVPDLVVLDLGLPRMDGVEVCRRLRAEGDVPILMLTARAETEDRVEGLDSGADDYLVKPFERRSCWPGSAPCCAGGRRAARPRCRSATSASTPIRARSAAASARSS